MLDILFVLLLFFMITAGVQKHEAGLRVPLPGKGPGDRVQVNLAIAADGQVQFNGVSTDTPGDHQLPETLARLKAVIADTPDRPIVINPDPGTRQQRVVDVLNACTAVHARNVAFASLAD